MSDPAPPSHYLRLLIARPDQAAREIIALGVPVRVLWPAFWLLATLNAILLALQAHTMLAAVESAVETAVDTAAEPGSAPVGLIEMLTLVRDNPITVAIGQAILFYVLLQALDRVGRAMGGTGDFRGALQVIVVVLAVGAALMAGQLVGLLVLPLLATVLGLGFLIFLSWHVPGLVMGLHGFRRRFAVLAMIIFTFVIVQMGLSLIAATLQVVLL
jgi:hypothetical protein